MTKFNKGDKVRYKDSIDGSYASWAGLEATVTKESGHVTEVLVTKDSPNSAMFRTGRSVTLVTTNLELVKTAPKPELKVGDKVRLNSKASNWEGAEGVITALNYAGSSPRLKLTKTVEGVDYYGYSVGKHVTLPAYKLDLIETESARVVELCEIQEGDTIRVTYPEVNGPGNNLQVGVTERVTVVRSGKVKTVDDGELIGEGGFLINSRLDGLDKAVYELLDREPVKVRTMGDEPVGAQFTVIVHDGTGENKRKRMFTKIGEDNWTDVFFDSASIYKADDAEAASTFRDRDGQWVVAQY